MIGSKLERSTTRLYIAPGLLKLYAEYIMQKAGLEESKAGIKIAEAPILWPSHEKRRLPGKAPDIGKV